MDDVTTELTAGITTGLTGNGGPDGHGRHDPHPDAGLRQPSPGDRRATRAELGGFLRSRRERLSPEDLGLAPGPRRRTPGLRREEVAQHAGVSVTWYTWLEQGRPINASAQVLDAVARTLHLDVAERLHLYRLAGLDAPTPSTDVRPLEPEVQKILDALSPLPACVYNGRYDALAWNDSYAALFFRVTDAPPDERNALWQIFTAPTCCCPFVNRQEETAQMVATVRGNFARHVGDPVWTAFVQRLSDASAEFAQMWAGHDVAEPGHRIKVFRHLAAGEFQVKVTSLSVTASADIRMHVYTAAGDADQAAFDRMLAEGPIRCTHGR